MFKYPGRTRPHLPVPRVSMVLFGRDTQDCYLSLAPLHKPGLCSDAVDKDHAGTLCASLK